MNTTIKRIIFLIKWITSEIHVYSHTMRIIMWYIGKKKFCFSFDLLVINLVSLSIWIANNLRLISFSLSIYIYVVDRVFSFHFGCVVLDWSATTVSIRKRFRMFLLSALFFLFFSFSVIKSFNKLQLHRKLFDYFKTHQNNFQRNSYIYDSKLIFFYWF